MQIGQLDNLELFIGMIEIIKAIEDRVCIKFKYKKETTYRKVDVYIIGINSSGELLIRGYEIGEEWKLFKVSQMNNISLTSEKCYKRPGYKPSDKVFKKILKKV